MKNVTSCCARIRTGLRSHIPLLLAAVALTGSPVTSQASATATVTGITYKQGSSSIDVVIAVPRRISRSARKDNKNHQIRVTVSYISVNGTGETVDSGPTLIANTTLLGKIPGTKNVSILLRVELGVAPPPGGAPNFTSTIELLTQKKPTGDDDCGAEDDDDHGDDHG